MRVCSREIPFGLHLIAYVLKAEIRKEIDDD